MQRSKIHRIKRLLQQAEYQTNKFSFSAGIACSTNCGICCLKPDIEATVLEFIPAAYYLFKSNRLDEIWNKLESQDADGVCVFYQSLAEDHGNCGMYEHRGLICRLFGYSTQKNKHGALQLVTCKKIKQLQNFGSITDKDLVLAPNFVNFYSQLSNLDLQLGSNLMPINEAIKKALEIMFLKYLEYENHSA